MGANIDSIWLTIFIITVSFWGIGIYLGKSSLFKNFPSKSKETLEKERLSKENEEILRQKKSLVRCLQIISEGVIVTTSQGKIFWANQKALEILKTSWITIQEKLIQEIIPINDRENKQNFQIKLRTLDAESIDVNVQTFPMDEKQTDLSGNIYLLENITEKVGLKEMKLNFVAIAAHQLRTPFTSIKGYLCLLKETILSKLTDEEKTFFERTMISTDRMGFLIENLLNISKIERGALQGSLKPIDLNQVIQTSIDGLSAYAKDSNVIIIYAQTNKSNLLVMGDTNLLVEALSNIIQNGIKYNHPGGSVTLSVENQKDYITLLVTDTGRGISENAMPHLFQTFYGGTNSLSQLSNGLGLGLYISKSIIEKHHGKIWVNSLEGKGTTVSISLPLISSSNQTQGHIPAVGL